MDIVQASFQASFDSRVERLGDGDLADLRVIFRYFDTDGDGAVSADQACRMFALLGLEVNTAQVRELGEVYLNGNNPTLQVGCICLTVVVAEFMKIVDSHVLVLPPVASEAPEAPGVVETPTVEGAQPIPGPPQETERKLRDEKVLEDEWRLLDTYHRGRVSMQELTLFLASCGSTLSLDDTERFLETYGSSIENDGVEELEFTEESFLKFRHEYTPKKMAASEDDSSSDDDDENGLVGNAAMLGQRVPDATALPEASQVANNGAASMRVPSRHAERGPSDNSSDHVPSSREPEFVINPDELVESDESDEDAVPGSSNTVLPIIDDGNVPE
ncbi:hypothetical protein PHYPSEUDO_003191 [Phytophthora pseudosyringae]|uniref:EF-hand domain-containing protein n=1 Tax=Phytophthora pseudosyringae TaxID=221518 RepID=A0A8T1VV79_9STRA|nr:hypothetical protein PHYPSEUDO_003191 [Phytophthora pseudosyringae]